MIFFILQEWLVFLQNDTRNKINQSLAAVGTDHRVETINIQINGDRIVSARALCPVHNKLIKLGVDRQRYIKIQHFMGHWSSRGHT